MTTTADFHAAGYGTHASDRSQTLADARRAWLARPHPGGYFGYAVVVIAWLIYLALGNTATEPWTHFPFLFRHFAFDQIVPLWVPWGGALGGATISLVGVVGHADEWDGEKYRWWHLSRPFLGGVSGTFAVLIVVFVLQSVTAGADGTGYGVKGTAVLTAIAFVVGYREETFRELVKRVVDLVLRPTAKDAAGTVAFVPGEIDFGTVATTTTATQVVQLFNASPDTLQVSTAHLTGRPADLVVTGTTQNLAPNASWPLTLAWTPTAAGPLAAALTLTAAGRSVRLVVRGTAG